LYWRQREDVVDDANSEKSTEMVVPSVDETTATVSLGQPEPKNVGLPSVYGKSAWADAAATAASSAGRSEAVETMTKRELERGSRGGGPVEN
jgi:hypothetical protein